MKQSFESSSNSGGGAIGYGVTRSEISRPSIPPQQPADVPVEIKEWLDGIAGVIPECPPIIVEPAQ